MKLGFHGHMEEAYLRFMDKKLKEKRAASGLNPLLRDIYLKVPCQEAKAGAPISPILSPYGLNVNDFVVQFNNRTATENLYGLGIKIPTVVNVFENKSTKFFFTTLFSFFIVSNNSNRYRLYRLKDLYKRYLLIVKSIEIGTRRLWSKVDMLYKRMPSTVSYNYICSNRILVMKKFTKKMLKRKKNISSTNSAHNVCLKTVLSTIKGTKSLVYVSLPQLSRGTIAVVSKVNFFLNYCSLNHNNFVMVLEKNILSRNTGLYRRLYKLVCRLGLLYKKWAVHLRLLFQLKLVYKCIKHNLIYLKRGTI